MGNKKVIKCMHTKDNGKVCGTILAKQIDNQLCIKRHGREVWCSCKTNLKIKCERCGGITEIGN